MPSPLEKDMGGVNDAHYDRTDNAAPETKPESSQDDGYVVEPLENVMEHRKVERREIVQEAYPDDESRKKQGTQYICVFHKFSHSANMHDVRLSFFWADEATLANISNCSAHSIIISDFPYMDNYPRLFQ
jgi:hypothetical protein